MCSKCLATGVHQRHKFSPLSQLFLSEHSQMLVVQEQVKETMRGITSLTKKIDYDDVRLERSYEQTRSHVENFFRSVQDLANDRERTLIEQVDSKHAELVGKLKSYYLELDAAEKNCHHWLGRKQEVIERLKSNDISATGEYNDCMAGLKQAEQAVAELNARLVEILQRPPVITFTPNEQQADELKEAIKNLGEFDKYTTTAFQEPDVKRKSVCSSNLPYYVTVAESQSAAHKDETDLAKTTPKHAQYIAISSDHVCPPTQYELPSSIPPPSTAPTIQPYSVIPHFQMEDHKEMSVAMPTRACVYLDNILFTEEGTIRCLQSGRLTKKITKMGRNKLKRPEGITYYSQKGKFLVVDSFSRKLIKVKPDTGKAVEVDLPHIITPGDIAITTGPTPTIFITDTQSLCVHKYSTNGTHKGTIPLQGFGVQRPAGIA